MTQEHTPTDEVIKNAACFPKPTRLGEPYPIDPSDYDRWLAAHDAQIRAEALTLTDKESNKLSEVIWNYVEDEDLDAATGEVKSTLETIAKTRMEQE